MVSLKFYGGVNEIGGNKILLEDGDTRVFLDFGMSFGRKGLYFEEFLPPRTVNGIGDFIELGLIPDQKGLYRNDLMNLLGREKEDSNIDGVILSHAHADHANYISFLHEEIPIHCGKTTHDILEAIKKSGWRDIESEIIDFKERPITNPKLPPIKRIFNKFRTGDKFKINSLEIEPIHVDHSVPGAYGFIIHTSEGAVVYTGDFRLHGSHPEMTQEFIQKAADSDPCAMITEGTRIDMPEDDSSEKKVYAKSNKVISSTKDLAIVDFNFKDVDRIRTFYNIAKECGRKFVISYKNACFLDRYSKDKKLDVPSLFDPFIAIYKPKKKTGQYAESDYPRFARRFLNYPHINVVTPDDIRNHQNDYLIAINFWSLNELVDLSPLAGSTYVHSLSEAFNEEMAVSEDRMKNWIQHYNLNLIQSHCSGHASGNQIIEAVNKINPKKLFPIHTQHQELFTVIKNTEIIHEEGEEFIVG